MSHQTVPVTVSVLDKEFRIGCPQDERESLIQAAQHLDRKMREIKAKGKVIGIDKISIMAALHISHELLHAKQNNQTLTTLPTRLKSLKKKAEEELGKGRQIAL